MALWVSRATFASLNFILFETQPYSQFSIMKKFFLAAAALLVGAVVFTSCSSNSPKAVADKFLTAFYHMEYEEAKKYSTDETKSQMDMMSQISGMMGDTAKQEAKKMVIDIKDVKEEGETATVTYAIKDVPGKETAAGTQTLKMVKQKGKWLASWNKQDMMGADTAPAADPAMGMEPTMDPAAAPMDPAVAPMDPAPAQ